MKKATLYIVLFFISLLSLWALWTWNEVGNYPDKLWLHRCNSILKYEEQKSLYPHVELDLIVRENGVMDITHEPTPLTDFRWIVFSPILMPTKLRAAYGWTSRISMLRIKLSLLNR